MNGAAHPGAGAEQAAKKLFTRGKKCQGTTSQLGEKVARMDIFEGFVSGHEFTRAANASKNIRALAHEGHISGEFVPQKDFFTKLFSRADKSSKLCDRFTSCGKTLHAWREVSGHDFSRADKICRMMWASQAAENPNQRGFVIRARL